MYDKGSAGLVVLESESRHAGSGHGLQAGRGVCVRAVYAQRQRLTGSPRAAAGAPFFSAKTQYAGAFLLMPEALDWLATAQNCFADAYGSLRQGLLTSVFSLAAIPGV